MSKILLKNVLYFFFITTALSAQQGKLDTTFNTFDDGSAGEGFDGSVRVVIENTDESSYLAGDFLNFNGATATRIIKLDSDGNSDTGFVNGVGFDNSVTSGFKTISNKLLYGGSFLNYNGFAKNRLARINLDGTFDVTFNTSNSGPNNTVQALAQFSDGSIVVAGDAITEYNGITVNNVFKINSEGVLDTAFNANITAGTTGTISKVLIQPDGKILICGSFTSFNGTNTRGVTRLNTDGTVDTAFNTNLGTGADNNIPAIDIQTDGKIVLGGAFTSFNGTTVGRIIRLNTDGTIDTTFNNAKVGFVNGIVQMVRFTSDGIYAAGSFTGDYNGAAAKLNRLILLKTNGDIDTGFDTVTGLTSSSFYSMETAIDGQIYLGGSFTTYDATARGRLLKVDKNGNLDSDFMSSGGVGANSNVFKTIPLSSKKVMIFGSFTSFNGAPAPRMARLNEDGTLDSAFNSSGTGVSSTIRTAVQLADGSFLIGGDFNNYNGSIRNRILKINADGILDASFNPNITGGNVYVISIDSNGKILIGGSFTSVEGIAKSRLARLNSDGTLDAGFVADADDIVEAISIETTGNKVTIGGRFLNYNGVAVTHLVRINNDGSLDTSFNNTNGPNNIVYSLARQYDGGLLVGGSFTTFGGLPKKRFLRVTDAGLIDTAFDSGIAFSNGSVRTITVQPDDQIILGGQFSGTYNGSDNIAYPVRRITRLNNDGSYNKTFKTILNNVCYTTAIDSEGRIMIGGSFNSVNGNAKYRIARLLACINNTTYSNTGWTRGIPDKKFEVSIDSDLTLATNTNFCNCSTATAKKLTVEEDVILTLEFDVFGDAATKSGSIEFKNNASLIQNDSLSVNTGNIIYNRSSFLLKDYDYVYWSSPVSNETIGSVFPGNDKSWNFINKYWYSATIMTPGVGYIVRYINAPFQKATFTGLPNNGSIIVTPQSEGHNLLGNPYPSAISADDFIKYNGSGALSFWTHNTARELDVSGTKYKYSQDDYAVYNLSGAAAAASGGDKPNGTIAAGQSFFVIEKEDNFTFNNSMRIAASGSNSQFFKQSNTKKITKIEKNRVWLNLTNEQGVFKQLLVGYITGATNDMDIMYDAPSNGYNAYVDFYSIGNSKNYTIQGRALPFDKKDKIPLGYKTAIEGTFAISIDEVDGLLINQPIYLEDKVTNTIFDLTKDAYSFTTIKGEFKERFILHYDDVKLNTADAESKGKGIVVSVKNFQIKINSSDQNIASLKVFDLKGSLVYEEDKINNKEFRVLNLKASKQFMIVMVQLEDGKWLSEEIIFHD